MKINLFKREKIFEYLKTSNISFRIFVYYIQYSTESEIKRTNEKNLYSTGK